MEITIKTEPKEIAALLLEIEKQPTVKVDELTLAFIEAAREHIRDLSHA